MKCPHEPAICSQDMERRPSVVRRVSAAESPLWRRPPAAETSAELGHQPPLIAILTARASANMPRAGRMTIRVTARRSAAAKSPLLHAAIGSSSLGRAWPPVPRQKVGASVRTRAALHCAVPAAAGLSCRPPLADAAAGSEGVCGGPGRADDLGWNSAPCRAVPLIQLWSPATRPYPGVVITAD